MAAPASEDLRELERVLTAAAERGESCSVGGLREEMDVGTAELSAMLDTLREHGKAVEEAPGEWRGPLMDEIDAAAPAAEPLRVVVNADVPEAREVEEIPIPRGRTEWTTMGYEQGSQPTVRLTRAIAEALDADALGKLVKAGLEDVGDGVFVLEVTP
jgi:hypothetical protein